MGNDIDVFLEPLVDDLHTLFETGVDTYDASTKDNFNLRAVVLWTINDYPALGTLYGYPYIGFKGCVVCGKDTNCVRLSASSKQSYVGHRRYLPYNHPFIKQKKAFNGQQEFLQAPIPMTGEQIYNEQGLFSILKGFDYEETFSPVTDIRAIRILIAIVAFYDYEIWQMDVKTAFLNGHLSKEVNIVQPEGFVNLKLSKRVCQLKRSIYGLKQASRQWNKRFDDEIKKFGFSQNRDEPCVYMKASGSCITFLILYIGDILIMGNNIPMLQDVKSYLGRCFAMKDLGEAAYILGIKIYRDRSKWLIGLCQSAYIEKILKRYFMENSKRKTIPMQEKLKLSKSQGASTPAKKQRMQNVPYASSVGSIMYAMRCTRPDTGYVFILNGGVVDWKSTKQSIFATSSTDAEYIAAFDASKEAVWIQKFISRLGVVPTIEKPINMYCDNTGAIAIAKDHGVTKGARHFCAKVRYLRETIEMGDVRIVKVDTDDNLADPFTKALAFPKHSELTRNIGLIPASSLM
ncbi:retrotransposon protein, putative, ty1-copia subclass [Tanacetum coccineum]